MNWEGMIFSYQQESRSGLKKGFPNSMSVNSPSIEQPLLHDYEQPDHWQRVANLRWGIYLTQVEQAAIDHGMQIVGDPGEALDIGCEGGRWTRMMLDRGWDVTSTEVCERKVAKCQELNPQADCRLVSPTDQTLPVEDASMDFIVSIEVDVNEQPWFAKELYRVLRPGGVVAYTINNSQSWRGVLANAKCRLRKEELYYISSYRSIRRQLKSLGFEMQRQEGFCWLPFGRFSDSRWVSPLTNLERMIGLRKLATLSPWVMVVCQKKA